MPPTSLFAESHGRTKSFGELFSESCNLGQGIDESRFPDGTPRPGWDRFLELNSGLSVSELQAKQDEVNLLLREHGASFTLQDQDELHALDHNRNWKLDILPLIISANEWTTLEKGLIQRSRLIRMIADDLYGERRLLKDGWIPPGLLFANPGFIRAAHGIRQKSGNSIFYHSVDLARDKDGNWTVLADRTQAPSGKGFALENRVVLSSLFPDEFKELNVKRLASFLKLEKEALYGLAPHAKKTPLVVMFTPGSWNNTYFEHAYKARYMDFPLVEGADLTVRDRKVYLKTLEGLKQVDVIIRRVDDEYCDPLELRSDTWLGIPGLTEAWRSGNVAMANGLGSGVVETTALLPFLPGLCQHLLSEPLMLSNTVTWWCGQHQVLKQIESDLDRYVIKRAFVGGSGNPIFTSQLSSQAKAELLQKIRRCPQSFAAQEHLNLSTAPAFSDGKLEQRPLVLRCYIVSHGDELSVMPGGLTRVSPTPHAMMVSMQKGGISKDTWILSHNPVETFSMLPSIQVASRPEKIASSIPSRIADHFFWLGRYAERLEGQVRILRTVLSRLMGERSEEQIRDLNALVQWLHALNWLPYSLLGDYKISSLKELLISRIHDTSQIGSVTELMGRLKINALTLRSHLSDDTWRSFSNMEKNLQATSSRASVPDALHTLNLLIHDLAAFSGMEMENMTRGLGWRFLDAGRRLERSSNLCVSIRGLVLSPKRNDAMLGPLLEIFDSSMTYHRRYHAKPELGPVLDLLCVDETNPRSIIWQLQQLSRHSKQFPKIDHSGLDPHDEHRQIDVMLSTLTSTHFQALTHAEEYEPGNLKILCDELENSLSSLSNTIIQRYFSHSMTRVNFQRMNS